MKRYVVGWESDPLHLVTTLKKVREMYPEVFDKRMTFKAMVERRNLVNSEGNYFGFVFQDVEEE